MVFLPNHRPRRKAARRGGGLAKCRPPARYVLKQKSCIGSRLGEHRLEARATTARPHGPRREASLTRLTGLAGMAAVPREGIFARLNMYSARLSAEWPTVKFYRALVKMVNFFTLDGVQITKNRHDKEFSS